MKHVTELTSAESLKVETCRMQLRNCALLYALHPDFKRENALCVAARRFDSIVREVGLDGYWTDEQLARVDYC